MKKYSQNKNAEKIMGKRSTRGIAIDQPCELGYHCPICKYSQLIDGNYDERLMWSEYEGFLWCSICNLDIPSCLCVPNLTRKTKLKFTKHFEYSGLKDAIKVFLNTIEGIKTKKIDIPPEVK